MPLRLKLVAATIIPLVLTACNIGVREDIFLKKPIWESSRVVEFLDEKAKVSRMTACTQLNPKNTIAQSGLSLLAKQVLNEDVRGTADMSGPTAEQCNPKNMKSSANDASDSSQNLVPPDLAKEPVTKAIVETIVTEYEKLGAIVRYKDNNLVPLQKELPERSLSRREFKNFAEALIRTLWKPYQENEGPQLSMTIDKNFPIPWQQLFTSYLMEYYNGGYADRYGVKYKKPAVGFSITNEVIVALTNIFQDSLWDYVQLGLGKNVKAPIVYKKWEGDDATGRPSNYVNANDNEPSFAKLVTKKILNPLNQKDLPGVIEKVVSSGSRPGLTIAEVCVVHHMSGFSGEASEAITGLIARSFGGLEVGAFVLFGKFSFGDHETLTKLIDAAVETFSRRSADVLVSHILHDTQYDTNNALLSQAGSKLDWEWFKEHIKLAELLDCLEKRLPAPEAS